jgi:SAM-dependent methyltransferase
MSESALIELFGERFEIDAVDLREGKIWSGTLKDRASPGRVVPVRGGIPRFVQGSNYADAFGLQWNEFRSTQLDSRTGRPLSFQRFWANTRWLPRELHGKRVLEAGSGAGRFTEVILDAGARVATFDLSSAIDANRRNNDARGEAVFFQGDIFDIPCPDEFFDFVFCYGVLQHTPDADRAFRELVRTLRSSGRISIDFYPKTRKLDPFNQPKYFWRRWTVGMPPDRLLRTIRGYMPWWLPVDTAIRRIPGIGPKILAALRIPCWNYTRSGLTYEQRLEWAVLDTFDALSARYDLPRTLEEVRAMATLPELKDIEVFYGSNGVVANATRR